MHEEMCVIMQARVSLKTSDTYQVGQELAQPREEAEALISKGALAMSNLPQRAKLSHHA